MGEEMREGDLLAGRYRIGRRLGRGAMGEVRAAEHLLLKELVAVKFMTAERCQDDHAVARFLQEARAVRKIMSDHVVRVLDVAVKDDGVPYIVMEYLEGRDLAAKLATSKRVSVREAATWIIEACEGVGEAHRMGVIHRDLKPANLFLLERPNGTSTVKVLDFGISKSTRVAPATMDAANTERSAGLTGARAVLGSPSYMAPEQMDAPHDVDGRCDIWSLGVTLFELVTGEVPFGGHSILQIYTNIRSGDPERWRGKLCAVPRPLAAVIEKCLAVDRNDRFATTAELGAALAPLMTLANADRAPVERKRTGIRWSAALGPAVLLLVGIGALQRISHSREAPVPTTSSGASSATTGKPSSMLAANAVTLLAPGASLTTVDAHPSEVTDPHDFAAQIDAPAGTVARLPVHLPPAVRPNATIALTRDAASSTPVSVGTDGGNQVAPAGSAAVDFDEIYGSQK
jgi:eukaryotic-like serine/threonine-protein kinase